MEIHHHNKDVFYLAISFDEARLMLNKNEEKLTEFAEHLLKATTWVDDNKRIFTKRLFAGTKEDQEDEDWHYQQGEKEER